MDEADDDQTDRSRPTEGEEEEDATNSRVEYFCGFGKCRPKCLQVFRSIYFFTFLICCDIFIEGALVTGFLSVTLSTIQRRYDLSSTQSGLIVSVFDIAVIACVIFVSYFGGKGHKPRWLGIGLLLQGLGSFIFALPEFVFGSYGISTTGNTRMDVCDAPDLTTQGINNMTSVVKCSADVSQRYSLVFFFVGNILIGFGAAPLFTVGPSFVDDIVRPKYVSFHLAIFYGMAIIGPALGFGLGAGFLSVYVDFWEETSLEPTDPAYVGAWWLCFLFSCVVSWVVAAPFLMFPRLLPDSHLVKEERQKQMAQSYKKKTAIEDENSSVVKMIVSLPHHFLQICTTLTWVFITIAVSFSAFVVAGVATFTPLYYQTQFNLTAATASVVTGAVSIPSGFIGVMIGGLLIFLAKSDGKRVALINTIVTFIAMPPLLLYLIRCPTLELAGVTRSYSNDQFLIAKPFDPINASCFSSCDCNFQSNVYQPVCGGDGLTYTSPCRAGCSVTYDEDMEPVYENCTCIMDKLKVVNFSTARNYSSEDIMKMSVVSHGACDNGCRNFVPHVIVSFLALALIFMLAVPNIFITIRCVADEQRTFALGLQSFLFRLFGNIPGPIVFGVVFDIACIFRNYTFPCGSTEPAAGACWTYNNILLSNALLVMALVAIGINFIFSFLSWISYKKNEMLEDSSDHRNNLTLKERKTSD